MNIYKLILLIALFALFLLSRILYVDLQYSILILLLATIIFMYRNNSYVSLAYCLMLIIFYLVPGFFQKLANISYCNNVCEEIVILIVGLVLSILLLANLVVPNSKQKFVFGNSLPNEKIILVILMISACYNFYSISQGLLGRALLIDKGIKNINTQADSLIFLAKMILTVVASKYLIATRNKLLAILCFLELSMLFLLTGARSMIIVPLGVLIFRVTRSQNRSNLLLLGTYISIAITGVIWSTANRLKLDSLTEILASAFLGSTNFYIELERSVGLLLSVGSVGQSQIGYTIVSFVPRFLWSGKPINEVTALVTYDAWGVYELIGVGNVLSGFIGQFVLGEGFILGLVSIFTLISACLMLEVHIRRNAHNPWAAASLILLIVAIIANGRFMATANLILPLIALGLMQIRKLR
jgi:hypothetical protein